MKHLLVLAALAFGLATTADARPMPTENTSWNTLDRDMRVYFEYPQFQLSHGYFVRAPGVCVDGDTLRTKKMKKKCVQTQGRNDRCVKWINIFPSKAMDGTRRVCTRYTGGDNDRCTRWEDVPYSIETSYDIKVSRLRNLGDGDQGPGRYLFTKNFTIPACN